VPHSGVSRLHLQAGRETLACRVVKALRMLPILFKTLPFFALIGLGYWAGRARFFTEEATA